MGAELGDFAGGFLTHVNRDRDHGDKSAGKDKRHQPGGDGSYTQGPIKAADVVHRVLGVQKNFRDPRHDDEDKNENVISL